MLKIFIPQRELWNEELEQFMVFNGVELQMEHSLVSISKWESKWHKSFLSTKNKTSEELMDYIRCMTITQNVPDEAFSFLTPNNISDIEKYIEDPMTATTFSEDKRRSQREIVTSELIYYWMIALNIPFECQKWHLNRLLTLITVCSIKNQPSKKMSKSEIMRRNSELNAARRKRLNTRG